MAALVSLVVALACGGKEFSGDGEPNGGNQSGGSAGRNAAGGSSAGRAGSAAGGAPVGGKGGAVGVSGGGPKGGAAGAAAGGVGGNVTSGGNGGAAGGGGTGGAVSAPCLDKVGQACLDCCFDLAPPAPYEQVTYECACSEPCYSLCEANCNTSLARTPECHECVLRGLEQGSPDLCHKDANECAPVPECAATAQCLSRCL